MKGQKEAQASPAAPLQYSISFKTKQTHHIKYKTASIVMEIRFVFDAVTAALQKTRTAAKRNR